MMNKEQSVSEKIEPVRKQLKVELPMEAAFRLFTDGINRWWPLLTHSVGEEQAETCYFEGWVGGRIYEAMKDGNQAEWGRVLVWEPPVQVTFSWYPGREAQTAQQVTVTFSEVPGGALLDLVHSGWEALGESAQTIWESYQTGWDFVLGKYASQASSQ
jgi:Activator of Hsp90 ATPase homolog 1-like protein